MKNIFKKLALYSATIGLLSILLVSCKEEIPFTVDKHEYISYNELVTNQQIGCVVKNSSFIAYSTSKEKLLKKYKDKTINVYNQAPDSFITQKHNKLIIITYQIQ